MTFEEFPESPHSVQPVAPAAGQPAEPASAPEPVQAAQPSPVVQPVQPLAPKVRARGSGGTLLLAFAAIVAVGGIAFAAGRLSAPAGTIARGGGSFPGGLQGGYPRASLAPGASFLPGASFAPDGNVRPGGGLGLGRAQMTLTGTISAISADTLTLTMTDGRTIEVGVADATWHAQASASAADAAVGSQVLVQLSGGFGRDPGAGQGPGASAAPDTSTAPGTAGFAASDVTILQR